jgi:hypothetical protein
VVRTGWFCEEREPLILEGMATLDVIKKNFPEFERLFKSYQD